MKLKVLKKGLLVMGGLILGSSAYAQYLRTSYFMEGTSSRIQLNPGLQPTRGYFNFPVIGSLNVGASSNVLGTSDIVDFFDSDGTDIFDNDDLYNRLKSDNRLNVNLNTDIFSFGWYKGKGFWSVNVGLRTDVGASVPKDMFEYLRDANHYDGGAMNGSITDLKMNINAYAEIGLGYSRPITDRLTVGGRVKVLLGIANAEMEVNKFEIDTNLPADYQNPSAWDAGKTYTAEYTSKAQITTTMKGGCLSYDDNEVIDGFDFDGGDYGISGAGFGIDLGATYKLFDHVTLSAAVLDLGFIKWNKSHTTVASVDKSEKINVNMDNYDQYISDDFLDFERFSLKDDEDAVKSRTKKLSSTILLAGEYAMFDNKLSVGAMYTARFVEPKTMNELTLSATYRPKNWLNAAVSYSPIQACGKSLGIALKLGPLFLGTDYMFFGNNSRSVNAFVGLSFPMGLSKKDACCKN